MIKEINNIEILKEFNIEKTDNPFINYIVYFDKDIPVGYIEYNKLYEKIDIVNIFVKESYRNRKIGSNMLEYLINKSKKENIENITLEVNIENTYAIKLYKKYNFKEVAIRKGYYNGIDGILMELKL